MFSEGFFVCWCLGAVVTWLMIQVSDTNLWEAWEAVLASAIWAAVCMLAWPLVILYAGRKLRGWE